MDKTVVALLSKRKQKVFATIYTKRMSKALQLDIENKTPITPAIAVDFYPNPRSVFGN